MVFLPTPAKAHSCDEAGLVFSRLGLSLTAGQACYLR